MKIPTTKHFLMIVKLRNTLYLLGIRCKVMESGQLDSFVRTYAVR